MSYSREKQETGAIIETVLRPCSLGLLLLLLCCQIAVEPVRIVPLTSNWQITNENRTVRLSNVSLPSGVYSALYGEKVLLGMNDVEMRWISYDNWTYSTVFSFNASDCRNGRRRVNLTFDGIDTVAEIRLNHQYVGRTDNMFVRYSYEVCRKLQRDNLLEVEIRSPVLAARQRANQLRSLNMTIPPPICPSAVYNGECHMNMLRKMQASFGWDWGLAAPSMGIWKPVRLELYDVAVLRDVNIVTTKNTTHWNMRVHVFVDGAASRGFHGNLILYAVELLADPVNVSWHQSGAIDSRSPVIVFEQAFALENVVPWWPNGYGEQKLYPLHFTLMAWRGRREANPRYHTMSRKSITVGFRTIKLVEDSIGKGNSFYFEVNDVPIFMKGSNYIPSHILPELAGDHDRIGHLLRAARDAHMTMLRAWGGGIYESDYFYDLADRYGLLIWQDMMFACAMYPVDEAFLASVRVEVEQNALRIGHHASVAIFAANNENEQALVDNWYNTDGNAKQFAADYRRLYLGTVVNELRIVSSPARPRPLVSSPSNGRESIVDQFISAKPNSPDYGDVHFYTLLGDTWTTDVYPRARFISEYGFQGLPMLQSWLLSTNETVDNLMRIVAHRQHHPMGMLVVISAILKHFDLPPTHPEAHYAEALIYFSQIEQAMSTKVETEYYRSLRNTERMTMGALYWQLNDVWVAPSWASIDSYGNYKLLHYWAMEFFAPTAIIALYNAQSDALNVHLACDELNPDTRHVQVTRNIYLWSQLEAINTTTWPATLVPNGVHFDKVIPMSELITGDLDRSNCFMEFILSRGGFAISRTYFFPGHFRALTGVSDPMLKLRIASTMCLPAHAPGLQRNLYTLTIEVQRPAIFVYIELRRKDIAARYTLSQNGFMQVQQLQSVRLEFEHRECLTPRTEYFKVSTVNDYITHHVGQR